MTTKINQEFIDNVLVYLRLKYAGILEILAEKINCKGCDVWWIRSYSLGLNKKFQTFQSQLRIHSNSDFEFDYIINHEWKINDRR